MTDDSLIVKQCTDPHISRLTSSSSRLYRPTVNHWGFIMRVAVVVLLAAGSTVASLPVGESISQFSLRSFTLWICLWLLACSRPLLVYPVRCYQQYAPSSTRCRCGHVPSCSEYTIICFYKYGPVAGTAIALNRLRRCGKRSRLDFP